MFVGRQYELAQLEQWWQQPERLAMVWGRRRVGKTWLLHEFSRTKPHLFYAATGKPLAAELRTLSVACQAADLTGMRDLTARPFTSFDDTAVPLVGKTFGISAPAARTSRRWRCLNYAR